MDTPARTPRRSISREEMAKLPILRYAGRVCVVATPEDLTEAQHDFRQESAVGLDTPNRAAVSALIARLPATISRCAAAARRFPSPGDTA